MPVVGRRLPREGHGSILRKQIGIEQDARGGVFAILHVHDALILQTGVLEEEIAAALLERSGKTSVVPELCQLVLDRRPLTDRRC